MLDLSYKINKTWMLNLESKMALTSISGLDEVFTPAPCRALKTLESNLKMLQELSRACCGPVPIYKIHRGTEQRVFPHSHYQAM